MGEKALASYIRAGLLASNLLTTVLIGKKINIYSKRNAALLMLILLICSVIGLFTEDAYITYFIFPYGTIQFFMITKKFNSWILPTLFFVMQLCLIMNTWFLTVDIPRILISDFPFLTRSSYVVLTLFIVQNLLLVLCYFFLKLINQKTHFWNFFVYQNRKLRFLSIAILIVFIALIVLYIQATIDQNVKILLYTVLYIDILCLLITVITHNSFEYQKKNDELEILSEAYLIDQKKREISNEFQHDFKALLIALDNCLKENSITDARILLNQIIADSQDMFSSNEYAQINRLENLPIQGLILNFLKECSKNNLSVKLKLDSIPKNLRVDSVDLVRCVSILLNNALETTIDLDGDNQKKIIQLTVENDGVDTLCFSITNPVDKKVELDALLKKGFTTKIGHKGIGLNTIKKITRESEYINLYIKQTNHTFISELVVSYSS
ncbi:hypothetical protein RV02_GL001321 [Enterococcus gilvus]|nr:hypothetical protein RV02_GL001321 [Enterococcus gilvus]